MKEKNYEYIGYQPRASKNKEGAPPSPPKSISGVVPVASDIDLSVKQVGEEIIIIIKR